MKKKRTKKSSSLGMGLDSLLKATHVELEKVSQIKPSEAKQDKIKSSPDKKTDEPPVEKELPDTDQKKTGTKDTLIEEPTVLDVIQNENSDSPQAFSSSETSEPETERELPLKEETEKKEQQESSTEDVALPEAAASEEKPLTTETEEFHKDLEQLASSGKTQFEFLKFDVGGELIGLDVQIIQEIIKKPSLTVIPESPSYVEGIFSLRSRVIPLVNMGNYLGIYEDSLNENAMVIILHVGEVRIGLGVDRVQAISVIRSEDIKNPPLSLASKNSEIIKGIARIDEKAVTFLDPVALAQKMLADVNKHSIG